jgi:hypothetical protein
VTTDKPSRRGAWVCDKVPVWSVLEGAGALVAAVDDSRCADYGRATRIGVGWQSVGEWESDCLLATGGRLGACGVRCGAVRCGEVSTSNSSPWPVGPSVHNREGPIKRHHNSL